MRFTEDEIISFVGEHIEELSEKLSKAKYLTLINLTVRISGITGEIEGMLATTQFLGKLTNDITLIINEKLDKRQTAIETCTSIIESIGL